MNPIELDGIEPAWTLKEALNLVRRMEDIAISQNCHVGLMGSVLHKGSSTKDLDVLLYPHNTEEPFDVEAILRSFAPLGVFDVLRCSYADRDGKEVYTCRYGTNEYHVRIDFFYLS